MRPHSTQAMPASEDESQVALLLDRLCRGSREEGIALRRGELTCEVTRQKLFVFRVNPPGTNNSCPDPHRNPPQAKCLTKQQMIWASDEAVKRSDAATHLDSTDGRMVSVDPAAAIGALGLQSSSLTPPVRPESLRGVNAILPL
jgi:hypothetical protein